MGKKIREGRKVKEDLINAVAEELKSIAEELAVENKKAIYKSDVESVINTFILVMRKVLLSGRGIVLKGLGEFTVEDKLPRIIIHQFGEKREPHLTFPTKTIKFTVSKSLRQQVKQKFQQEGKVLS